jgi:Zn-dependent protease
VISDSTGLVERRLCGGCAAEIPASFLACPSCGKLVHAEKLKSLAAEAEKAEAEGDLPRALATWRSVLELLPPGAGQHQRVFEKVQALTARVAEAPPGSVAHSPAGSASGKAKWLAGLGAVGALLAKFKWGLLFLLGKGKLLLTGLLQAKTLFSMALAVGVYASNGGWKFGLGLVLSIYVHEMGHVAWLHRYGVAASAPMFIPGLGAFVRGAQRLATVGEDARVALAGPAWGAIAALGALAAGGLFKAPLLLAIAHTGAWFNLLNLAPLWILDGNRGYAALSRLQRSLLAATMWLLLLLGFDLILLPIALIATLRAAMKADLPTNGDRAVFFTFVGLTAGLALITRMATSYAAIKS